MLESCLKFFAISVGPVVAIILTKELLKYTQNIFCFKNIFTVLLLLGIMNLTFVKDYSFITTIVIYIMIILVNRIIFDKNIVKIIVVTTISLIIIAVADMLCSVVLLNFVDSETVRTNTFAMIISNVIVGLISLFLLKIKILKNKLFSFIDKFEYKKQHNTAIFFALLLILLSIFIYIISNNYSFTVEYWIAVLAIVIFFSLMFIFITESNKYMQLKNDYKLLFDYFKGLEEWIENERLLIHEHKNQLATIKSMTNNLKINNYIDDILNFQIRLEDSWIEELKYIPKGGLKGLLYYKLIIADKNKLIVLVNINKNVSNMIKKLDLKDLRDLTQIIGIYFDNAIEAAINTTEKNLSLEIYTSKGELNIVISNSIKDKISLNKIDNKDYSTKGKNRGNGLFYVKKILSENKLIFSKTEVINNYFIQKIVIKK